VRIVIAGVAAAALLAALATPGKGAQETSAPRPPLPRDQLRSADLIEEFAEGNGSGSRLGLPEKVPGLESTPAAIARLRLGRRLFFDPILSLDRTVSCASCHEPDHGFASREAKPLGVGGRRAERNAPPAFNRAFGTSHFWDGRAATLEAQVVAPIENVNEMALPLAEAVARLAADAKYRELFAATGAPEPTAAALASGIAEFLRRLVVADSPVDRFRAAKGDITPLERRGLWLFESKGHCWRCHAGPNFSDESFHDTGIGAQDGAPEPGRAAVTSDPADRGKFKTPTLRMVALTAPYMHDGSLATLEEVVRFYAKGGSPNDNLDPIVEPIDFTDDDVAAVVAFLQALSRSAEPPPDAADAAAGSRPSKKRAF
jgi:cytochrome c peroxidase